MIATFLVFMMITFVFFGAVITYIFRGIRRDSYRYDMQFLWKDAHVTLKDMEFAEK